MPAKYDAIKQKFLRMGDSEKEAKTRAAKIYNAGRESRTPPVTRNYEKTKANWGKGGTR